MNEIYEMLRAIEEETNETNKRLLMATLASFLAEKSKIVKVIPNVIK